MIHSQPKHDEEMFTADLTPLLDIIFIVMVFLLLTANIPIKTLNIDLPQTQEAGALSAPQKQMITVHIFKHDPASQQPPKWGIQGKPIENWDEFTKTLLMQIKRAPKSTVVIEADKNASVENMLNVLTFMQKHNIKATHILMEEK